MSNTRFDMYLIKKDMLIYLNLLTELISRIYRLIKDKVSYILMNFSTSKLILLYWGEAGVEGISETPFVSTRVDRNHKVLAICKTLHPAYKALQYTHIRSIFYSSNFSLVKAGISPISANFSR